MQLVDQFSFGFILLIFLVSDHLPWRDHFVVHQEWSLRRELTVINAIFETCLFSLISVNIQGLIKAPL